MESFDSLAYLLLKQLPQRLDVFARGGFDANGHAYHPEPVQYGRAHEGCAGLIDSMYPGERVSIKRFIVEAGGLVANTDCL